MRLHVIYMQMHSSVDCHGRAIKTDQPQALSLCAARGDRADKKGVAFERIDIDLAKKPDWFLAISPLGKTPVLQVGDVAIFESAVILEYLEETQPKPLHPADPLRRAEHPGCIEFWSPILNDIAGFYVAAGEATL